MRLIVICLVGLCVVFAGCGCSVETRRGIPGTEFRLTPFAIGPAHCGPPISIGTLPRTNRWRKNGWGSAQNMAVSHRIGADDRYLKREHVELSQWGPGAFTNRIVVYLVHFSARAARILYARYRCAILVSRHSQALPTAW